MHRSAPPAGSDDDDDIDLDLDGVNLDENIDTTVGWKIHEGTSEMSFNASELLKNLIQKLYAFKDVSKEVFGKY